MKENRMTQTYKQHNKQQQKLHEKKEPYAAENKKKVSLKFPFSEGNHPFFIFFQKHCAEKFFRKIKKKKRFQILQG